MKSHTIINMQLTLLPAVDKVIFMLADVTAASPSAGYVKVCVCTKNRPREERRGLPLKNEGSEGLFLSCHLHLRNFS